MRAGKLRIIMSECACLNVRKAARAVTQRYDDALKPAGVRSTQLPLLVAAGLRGQINISALAEDVVMDRTTLSRNLRLLERKAWITISPGDDHRTRLVRLTAQGWEVVRRALPVWEKVQGSVAVRLGSERLNRLLSDLSAAVSAITEEKGG